MKRIDRCDETWEADFQALPRAIMKPETHYLGMVVTKTDGRLLPDLPVRGRPSVNDLATLLTHAMRRPLDGHAPRPSVVRARGHRQWRELLPHLTELDVAVSVERKHPVIEKAYRAYLRRLREDQRAGMVGPSQDQRRIESTFTAVDRYVQVRPGRPGAGGSDPGTSGGSRRVIRGRAVGTMGDGFPQARGEDDGRVLPCYRRRCGFRHRGDDAPCFVDVILGTEDPADFEDAYTECLERLQERLDAAEDDNPTYAKTLQEWIDDTASGTGGWEEYASVKSQPDIPDPRSKGKYLILTEVEGRRVAREWLDSGGSFGDDHDRWVKRLAEYEAMAAVGAGVRTKVKLFKDRPRPPLSLWKVKVAPGVVDLVGEGLVRGLLLAHQRCWDGMEDYAPLNDGFDSRMYRAGDSHHNHLFTVFFEPGQDVTFVVALPASDRRLADDEMMKLATGEFTMSGDALGMDAWSPDRN